MNRTSVFVAAGAGLLLVLAAPAAASAHVTVAPNTTPAGSWALVDIKVPNESATAVTNKITLSLPTDTPILNVSYVPVAGWTTELVREALPVPVKVGGNTVTEAITTVTWTASLGAEHPAPVVYVNDQPAGGHHSNAGDHDAAEEDAARHDAVSTGDSMTTTTGPDVIARGLGIGGLAFGATGIAVAIAALRRKAA